jgi:uncharacterized protein YdeI (YjbR/CyaY-like superfamily)
MNQPVDFYFTTGCGRCSLWNTPQCKVHTWYEELAILRRFLLDCGLFETLKWRIPCYTFQENNVVLLSAFNDYCAVSFFKGALLSDADQRLIQQTENVQATRQLRFTRVSEILEQENSIKTYIFEAIEVEKAGLKVALKQTSDFAFPEELQQQFDKIPALKTAFEGLTPGRQRGYLLFFAAPKQSQTRTSRIEKSMPQIFNGKGVHD